MQELEGSHDLVFFCWTIQKEIEDQCSNGVILLEISFTITRDSHVRSYVIMNFMNLTGLLCYDHERCHKIHILGLYRTLKDLTGLLC